MIHLEITTGVISRPTRTCCGNLVDVDHSNVGKRAFFVEAVEADGGRIGLHDGFSYAAALAEAKRIARTEGLPIHDLAGGEA